MTESKIQMLYDNDDNPICPITSAKAVFDDNGRQIIDLLGASALVNGDNLIIQNRGNGKDMKHKSGSFVSAPDENGRVTVEVGFKPEFLKVALPFDSGDTYAVYDSLTFKDKTYWWIPMESSTRFYTIPDMGDGETGIVEITDTGFIFRSHAENTRNITCTYEAIMFIPVEGGDSKHSYSTEEQVVGTWIDGKPLYEATSIIHISGGDKNQEMFFDTPCNTDLDINFLYNAFAKDGDYCYPLPTMNLFSSNWRLTISSFNCHYADNVGRIWYQQDSDFSDIDLYVVYRYTKTTD